MTKKTKLPLLLLEDSWFHLFSQYLEDNKIQESDTQGVCTHAGTLTHENGKCEKRRVEKSLYDRAQHH